MKNLNKMHAASVSKGLIPLLTRLSGVATVMLALSSCGSKEPYSGQVIARVGDQEITIHQLNQELQRMGGKKTLSQQQMLDALIDRQIFVNEAKREHLDRDPGVLQALEGAKAQILAEAYLQKKIVSQIKPAKEEIENFFHQNPDMFAQRKQYELNQVVVDTKDMTEELSGAFEKAKSIDSAVAILEKNNVSAKKMQIFRNSTELPKEMLSALKNMVKGQLFTFKDQTHTYLLAYEDVEDSPVTEVEASPQIVQFLVVKKTREVGQTELKRLRSITKVEYLNSEFGKEQKPPEVVATSATAINKAVAGLK